MTTSRIECQSHKNYSLISERLYHCGIPRILRVMLLDVKLLVDGEEINLNKFVVKMLSGTIAGAVTALHGIKKDWKEIEIKVTR